MVTRIDAVGVRQNSDCAMQVHRDDAACMDIQATLTHTANTNDDKSLQFMELLEKNTGLSVCVLESTIATMEKIAETIATLKSQTASSDENSSILDASVSGTVINRLRTAAISILKSNQNVKVKRIKQNVNKRLIEKQGDKTVNERSQPKRLKWNNFNVEHSGLTQLRNKNSSKWNKVFQTENNFLPNVTEKITEIPFATSKKIVKQKKSNVAFNCYICRDTFSKSHHFYFKMCQKCGDYNFRKRDQMVNLHGKVALVTGGRIKIGYETVLKLLRCGAMVITTTRFPADASLRFSHENDFNSWKDRLHIYDLDLRFLRHVEMFCAHISQKYERLDILIQNAAQTIRRPVAFYRHLIENEKFSLETNPNTFMIHSWESNNEKCQIESPRDNNMILGNLETRNVTTVEIKSNSVVPKSVLNSQLALHPEDRFYEKETEMEKHFPSNCYDEDHQQVDLRPINSWILETDQVDTSELVEVNLVNTISPYIILSKLTPLMKKSVDKKNNVWGHIILVSSMEGKFSRPKTTQHPHTNCAKASLNMLARTSAPYYKHHGLLLDAVDTGWVTDEEPIPCRLRRYTNGVQFQPPLDCIDGAARILDPVFQNILKAKNNKFLKSGIFYKDYLKSDW